jgi:hypothetical protein
LLLAHTPLAADNQFFQIQVHQVLKIIVQILFGKTGKKFRPGALVDFTNAVYQLPFTHTYIHPSTRVKIVLDLAQYRQAELLFFSRPAAHQRNAP